MKDLIVAATCRKAGKTLLACSLVRVLSERGLSVCAFKVAQGGSEEAVDHGPGPEGTDTWRLSRAGAARVALVRGYRGSGLARICRELRGEEDVCIWESGAAAGVLENDCLAFISVEGCPDAKDGSDRLKSSACFVVEGPLDGQSAEAAAAEILDLLEKNRSGKEFRK